ncbi:MAG: hypothetical protein V3V23_04715 [Dehalococcoidales bacterium]
MVKRIIIVIVAIIIVGLGRGFFYYSGSYTPPPTEMPGYEDIVVPPAPLNNFSDDVSDNVSEEERSVLIDLAHENNFDKEELNVLILRLISRDLGIKFLEVDDDLETELLGKEPEEPVDQEEPPTEEEPPVEEPPSEEETPSEEEPPSDDQLPLEEPVSEGEPLIEEAPPTEEPSLEEEEEEEELPPHAFIIVAPQIEFTKEEKETIDEFMDNGGKILLIADPSRDNNINDISLEFGLIFESDYLYNIKENELNYRNIFISDFEESEITEDLEKIVLYLAGSISSNDGGIVFVDQNTLSSLIESRKKLSPIALAEEEKVLAVHDLTFMTEPYNGSLNNNQLIANIADWLAVSTLEEEEEESNDNG